MTVDGSGWGRSPGGGDKSIGRRSSRSRGCPVAKANYAAIPGSERRAVPGAAATGPIAPETRIEVTVRVGPRKPLPSADELAAAAIRGDASLSHDQYDAEYGADPADVARVEAFARAHHLVVVEASLPRRAVILAGTVGNFQEAFDTKLDHYAAPGFTYRGRVGPVSVPGDLGGVVEGVFGLDNRPVARAKFRLDAAQAPRASASTFDPPQVARAYNFPGGVDGTGQCIGIIELGGGYRPADLQAFFRRNGIKAPKVTPVSVPPGAERAGERRRRRGRARHRDRRRRGAGGDDRRVLRQQQPGVEGVPRRHHAGGPRPDQQPVGDLDQLGRPGGGLDRDVPVAVQLRPAGRGGPGDHRLRRLGRRRRRRRRAERVGRHRPRRLPGRQPPSPWPAAAPASRWRATPSAPSRPGTRAAPTPRAIPSAPPAAASAR